LISSGKEYLKLIEFSKNISRYGYKILGYLGDKESPVKRNGYDLKTIGNIKDLPNVLENNTIDEIFITISSLKEKKIKSSIKIADNYGVRVRLVPEDPRFIAKNCKANTLGDIAVFQLHHSPLDKFSNMILKRLFDFCFSLIVIVLLSPLFLIISLIIYIDKRGPVFYTPLRKGEGGKTFKCYKFRTMSVCDDPLNGTKSTVENDPRITRIGKLLRKNDLDELPQFFNVLKGNMSVVGPRPHRIILQNEFRKIVNNYMVRSYVKPGITGWAQVNGWRGPTVTNRQKKQRVKHDLWYIEHWNMLLDIKIVFLTIFGRHRKNAF
jgi:putative colanic acid biosynthesis UDP-glucose lipid carrier transferase